MTKMGGASMFDKKSDKSKWNDAQFNNNGEDGGEADPNFGYGYDDQELQPEWDPNDEMAEENQAYNNAFNNSDYDSYDE